MRIISGKLGGRMFSSPHGHHTHPMSEKIRGAIFNMLGDITGLDLLDAFSGSGALALEAVSRGAGHVTAVEIDFEAYKTIQGNLAQLNIDNVDAIRKNVKSWSRSHKETMFDVVLCDPPFDAVAYTLLHALATHVKPGGVIVYSLPPDHDFKLSDQDYSKLSEKSYGDAILIIYRRLFAK